ncbi:SGNH hydrolase domain-containing protein [Janthinobacterium tructae]
MGQIPLQIRGESGSIFSATQHCGVKILDPLPYLCHDGRCYASKDGRPLYFDDDHLSEYGNKLLIPLFQQVFNKNP